MSRHRSQFLHDCVWYQHCHDCFSLFVSILNNKRECVRFLFFYILYWWYNTRKKPVITVKHQLYLESAFAFLGFGAVPSRNPFLQIQKRMNSITVPERYYQLMHVTTNNLIYKRVWICPSAMKNQWLFPTEKGIFLWAVFIMLVDLIFAFISLTWTFSEQL